MIHNKSTTELKQDLCLIDIEIEKVKADIFLKHKILQRLNKDKEDLKQIIEFRESEVLDEK